MRARTVIARILFALYPLLVFAGLSYFDARTVGLLLLAALALRYRSQVARLFSSFSPAHGVALGIPPVLGVAVLVTNSEVLLRLYPSAISLSMLIVFGMTLLNPPSMVERFARLSEPQLPQAAVRYTRHVTQVWCGFFAVNGALAAYTAAFASRETWALYNGLIAYLLMGALFGGERLLRRRMMRIA
jgi:uncharacterized membrane protein